MTTITIDYEVSDEKIKEIEKLLTHEEFHNVNFGGEDFQIERGDFTCIDKPDAEYVILLQQIFRIIEGWHVPEHQQ